MTDNIQELISAKAEELFNLCDKEQKGFIIKKDIQRLRDEIDVEPEQLEDVFDSLDIDHNGFLTLQEFTCKFDLIYLFLIIYLFLSWFRRISK
jgi:Ras and EF-hand domain-containing protein